MKRLFYFLLAFNPFISHAQNWEIFNSYDRYNYKADGAPLITNVLFADSFKVAGSDTIYYLNRIVQKPNYIAGYDTVLKDLPQFFQKQIRRSTDGTYVFSTDSGYDGFNRDSFVIKAFADVGDNWLYDSTANITASVASKTLQILFGTTDSVKQINLSCGDSILLSKSFGIIGFPSDTLTATGQTKMYYGLQGIETRGIGDSVINFWSIYNFNVGDVFMYTRDEYAVTNASIKYKNTVLTKQVYPDSISYTVRNVWWEYDYQFNGGNSGPPRSGTANITLTFVDSLSHFANTYPNQFVSNAYTFPPTGQYQWHTYSNYLFSTPLLSWPGFNLPCKESFFIYDTIYENVVTGNMRGFPVGFSCEICQGVGDAFLDYGGPESSDVIELIGYIKNGVQTGTVYTDLDILGISTPGDSAPVISVYPTITNDYTYVRFSNLSISGAPHITFYDVTGRLILNEPLPSNRTKINCSNLPSAVYLWRVLDEKENVLGSGKLIKQ